MHYILHEIVLSFNQSTFEDFVNVLYNNNIYESKKIVIFSFVLKKIY